MQPQLLTTTRGSIPMEVLIRDPSAGDQGYVASTWVEQLCKADHTAHRLEVGRTVDAVLDHPNTKLLLACDQERSAYILGWLCWAPIKAIRLVHFAYTRAALRDRGVCSALRGAAGLADDRPLVHTMRGPSFKSLAKKYPTAIEHSLQEFLQ